MNLTATQNKICRPNAFIIGASKSGTSSLANLLGQHYQILLSIPKECNFFQTGDYHYGMDWMSKEYFRGFNQEKVVLDASPDYMHIKYVVPRIKHSCNNPKFIFILREPIMRAYSQWKMFSNFRPGRMCETFEEELKRNLEVFSKDRFKCEWERMANVDIKGGAYDPFIIEQGLYYTNIKQYMEEFGRESIFIMEMEVLIEKPYETYMQLCDFLEVERFTPQMEKRNVGKTEGATLEKLLEGVNAMHIYKNIYKHEISLLSDLVGYDLIKHWRYK